MFLPKSFGSLLIIWFDMFVTEDRLLEVPYSPASHSLVGKEGRLAAGSRSFCSGVASLKFLLYLRDCCAGCGMLLGSLSFKMPTPCFPMRTLLLVNISLTSGVTFLCHLRKYSL